MRVFFLRQRNAEHSNLLFSSKDGKILINFLRKATVPQSVSLEQGIDVLISSSSCKGTARLFPEGTEGKRHHRVISGGHNKLWEMHWLSQEFLTGGTRVTLVPISQGQRSRFQEPGAAAGPLSEQEQYPELTTPISGLSAGNSRQFPYCHCPGNPGKLLGTAEQWTGSDSPGTRRCHIAPDLSSSSSEL